MKKRILALSFLLCVCFSVNAMAADPVLIDCAIDTWTKVATNINKAEVIPTTKTRYFYTLRDTGGAAPANDDDALLLSSVGVNILVSPAVDIYVKTKTTAGTVRVATFNTMTINSDGHGEIVQNCHPDSSAMHFHIEDQTASSTSFILIDISDTTNYGHSNTSFIHIEWVQAQVDASITGNYELSIAFLEDVDVTSGNRYIIKHWSGTQQAGNQLLIFENMFPSGWKMRAINNATHLISLNNTDYQTDVNLATTLDPSSADTPPGAKDVIMFLEVTAGTINVAIDIGYHSH